MSEIKQINTGVAELLAVKVPEGAHSFTSYRSSITDTNKLAFITTDITCIDIPPGNWTPLGVDAELTEEQCREVVEHRWDYYKNYLTVDYGTVGNYKRFVCDTAKEAFASLMQANGCYSVKPDECPNQWCEGGKIDIGYNEYLYCELCEQAEANTGTWLVLKRLS